MKTTHRALAFVMLASPLLPVLAACGATPAPSEGEVVEVEVTPIDEGIGEETETVQPVPVPDIDWGCPAWDEQRLVGDFHFQEDRPVYVKNQIIVTGRRADVKKVVSRALTDLVLSEATDSLTLDWLPRDVLAGFPSRSRDPVVINSYATGSMSAEDAFAAVYHEAIDQQLPVFADLNYVTGHPHIVAGSPHIVAGSPFSQPAAAQVGFWDQWAFGPPAGIDLVVQGQGTRTIKQTGVDVRVGVFDTSPFQGPGVWKVPWIEPEMTVCVSHMLQPPQNGTPTADHGLFVSGLVHAVAPKCQIHLVQVLDAEARGVLATLNAALSRFINHRLHEPRPAPFAGTLANTVINLSLGFPQPKQLALAGQPELYDLHKELMNALEERWAVSPWEYEDDELPVVSLETIMLGATILQANIVAAAGNESQPHAVQAAHIPAAYRSVTGVAANNIQGRRAGYSNYGDVAAPGGESEPKHACESGLLSLVLNTAPYSGYACWVGTSFAAPLVSGQAALLLEAHAGQVPPDDVANEIRGGTSPSPDPDLQDGIVNLPQTLP